MFVEEVADAFIKLKSLAVVVHTLNVGCPFIVARPVPLNVGSGRRPTDICAVVVSLHPLSEVTINLTV